MTTTTDASLATPRIFIGTWSEYNVFGGGAGCWYDVNWVTTGSDLESLIDEHIENRKRTWAERYRNTVKAFRRAETEDEKKIHRQRMEDIKSVFPIEEYAFFDYANIPCTDENPDLAKLAETIVAIEEHGEAYEIYMSDTNPMDASLEDFQDKFLGIWDSRRAYADEYLEELGVFENCEEIVATYFDFETYTEHLFRDEVWGERTSTGDIAVFAR